MMLFIFYMMLVCKLASLFQSLNFIPVNACIFFHGIYHCNTFKRFSEIHLNAIVNDLRCAENFMCHMAVKIFCKIHHSVIICICLIKLHQCKFRIMSRIKSFVSEYTTDLVHSFKTSDDQTFQIKFKRNSQFQVFI